MLRNVFLLALLAGGGTTTTAHELRGGGEDVTYEVEAKQKCAEYLLKVCCGGSDCSESMTTLKSPEEVGDANVCGKQCPGKSCSWSWRAEGCSGGNSGGGKKSSIQCTKPRSSRVRSEGQQAVCASLAPKDVPYKCEDGSELCCTESDMDKVTFKDKSWGQCTKESPGGAAAELHAAHRAATADKELYVACLRECGGDAPAWFDFFASDFHQKDDEEDDNGKQKGGDKGDEESEDEGAKQKAAEDDTLATCVGECITSYEAAAGTTIADKEGVTTCVEVCSEASDDAYDDEFDKHFDYDAEDKCKKGCSGTDEEVNKCEDECEDEADDAEDAADEKGEEAAMAKADECYPTCGDIAFVKAGMKMSG